MSTGYVAATSSVAVFDRSDRVCLVVRGRAPGQMLKGMLTGRMPSEPELLPNGMRGGAATYTAALTPNGKMITDGRLWLKGTEEEEGFLFDVPAAGREGLLAYFRKFLPPRMAAVADPGEAVRVISVVGPEAAEGLASAAFGGHVSAHELSALPEGAWREALSGPARGIAVIRWADVWPEAFDVVGPAEGVAVLVDALMRAGVTRGEPEAWSTLRIEAGRPAFGIEMDESTLPVEAGIHERAIDYTKGCYTGQEVIVRIRDRGHVNRSLRLLHLGDVEPPAPGTELFAADSDRPAGTIASSTRSPRWGETIALAYVRRGSEEAELSLPG